MDYAAVIDIRRGACQILAMASEPGKFHLHLISDATGNTLQGLARAVLAQFEGAEPIEHFTPLVRTEKQLERALEDIARYRGPVLFTLVDADLRRKLRDRCREIHVPCVPVLDPIMRGLSLWLGTQARGVPGLQHNLDDAYFRRMDAVDFALSFDDGQNFEGIEDADVVLIGVSRTSKTPTCIFLARQGIRAANVPYVPGLPFPDKVLNLKGPLVVGLTESPDRLVHLRKNRLRANENDTRHGDSTYLDPDRVEAEIREARRFFTKQGWPVIDVTRRSVEETAAEIQVLLHQKQAERSQGSIL